MDDSSSSSSSSASNVDDFMLLIILLLLLAAREVEEEEEKLASCKRTWKRRRRARRTIMPIGNTGPTNTGSHSSLISDGRAPFKPRKSIKTCLSPQPNTDPATMASFPRILAILSGDKYMEKVRDAQLGMEIPNVVCVDAKGLELKDDHLHLTSKSQVQLGRMLADA